MKKHMVILLTAALLLAGCNAQQSPSSQSSINSPILDGGMGGWASQPVDKGVVQSCYQNANIVSVADGKICFVKAGTLADLYPGAKITDVTKEFTSIGDGVYPLYFLDDGRMLVSKNIPDSYASEYGIYSPGDKSYRRLFDSASAVSLLPVNRGETYAYVSTVGVVQNRWLVFEVNNMGSTSHGICLCDVDTGELKRIFAYTPPEVVNGTITSVYNAYNPVIDGGDIYWDDIAATRLATLEKAGECDVNIWHYSTGTGKAEKVVTQGWRPFVYKGELYHFGNGGGPCTSSTEYAGIYKAGSASPASIEAKYLRQVCGGDVLAAFGSVTMSTYEGLMAKDSRVPTVTLNDKGYSSTIMTSLLVYQNNGWQPLSVILVDSVGRAATDGRFVVWGGGGTPVFYDSKKDCIVTLPIETTGDSYYTCYLTADKLIYSVSSGGTSGEKQQYLSVDKASLT